MWKIKLKIETDLEEILDIVGSQYGYDFWILYRHDFQFYIEIHVTVSNLKLGAYDK